MPQMFDWIFFAIVLPVPAYLVWDWYQHRNDPASARIGSSSNHQGSGPAGIEPS